MFGDEGSNVSEQSFYLVESSRTGKGLWNLALRTLDKDLAVRVYDKHVEDWGNLVWRIVEMKEIQRSKG